MKILNQDQGEIQSVTVSSEMRVNALEKYLNRILEIPISHLEITVNPMQQTNRYPKRTKSVEKIAKELLPDQRQSMKVHVVLSKWRKLRQYGFRNGDVVTAVAKNCHKVGIDKSEIRSPTSDETIAMKIFEEEIIISVS